MKIRIILALAVITALNACTSGTIRRQRKAAPQQGYSWDEISKHTIAEDCWIVIKGKTYDATKYILQHPGGKAILNGCGKDATSLFKAHTQHSFAAKWKASTLFIGDAESAPE